MALYSVLVDGEMLYFYGDIPKSKYDSLDHIAKSISEGVGGSNDRQERFKIFISALEEALGSTLTPMPIEHVFRLGLQ